MLTNYQTEKSDKFKIKNEIKPLISLAAAIKINETFHYSETDKITQKTPKQVVLKAIKAINYKPRPKFRFN